MYIIIGCGSAGRQYIKAIHELGGKKEDITIIDINTEVLDEFKKGGYKTCDKIKDLNVDGKVDIGIITNLGPDHINTAQELVDMGIENIIIEKPIGNNIKQIRDFAKRAEDKKSKIQIHSRWIILEIKKEIEMLTDKNHLGNIETIEMKGGCLCVSTGGIHWLDLANQLMGSEIEYIFGMTEHTYNNPRGKEIPMIGAFGTVKYESKGVLTIAYNNNLSHAPLFTINYRNARIDVNIKGEIRLYQRNKEEVAEFNDKITRYGELNFTESRNCIERNPFKELITRAMTDKSRNSREAIGTALKSIKIIHGLEQSGREKRVIMECDIVDQDIKFT